MNLIDNWNKLEGKVEGKLLISNFNSNEIKLITNNTCIFSHSSSDFIPSGIPLINLSPRTLRNMIDDLANNIDNHSKAHEIIIKTNGLFSSFKRLVYHGKSEPIWNNFEKKELMIPALLIGQWETCQKDKESLEILAERSFEDYINKLKNFIRKEDPFLLEYLNKSGYKLANIDEAWVILKEYITAKDLENFKIIFLSIFSEIPEKFKSPHEQWNIIILSDKSSQYSPMLKKGVMQSLIKLSDVEENRDFVDNLIENIFKEINTKEEWLNISKYLPDLMEASPKILLKILHDEVEKSDSPFWSLFTNRSKDISFWGMNYYTSVLWALELALCFENFAIDSLKILVKIAEKNMEYKISNSPLNTLYTALSAWFHEINISISKKIKFVENTIKKESPISQDILNSILPNRNSTQSFSPMHKPQLKTYELVVSNITQQDIDNTYKEYIKIAVKNAELDLDKWLLIFEKLDFFDLSFEKEVFAGIQKTILSLKTDEEKYFLKERIREIIYKNRCYPTATWALEEEKIKLIEEKIFNKIKLSEKSFDYFYLFSKGRPQFLNPKYKFDKTLKNSNSEYSEYLKEIRIKAIKDIVNCNFSKENILKFISNLRKFNINDIYSNRHIGSIIGSFLEVNEETIELIIKLGEKNENDVLIEITKVLYSKNGQDLNFIKTLINSSISDITKSSIITLIDLNQEVVEILSSSNESIKREYWKSIHIPSLKEVEVEKNYIWQNLLRYSNFTQAYYFLEENFTLFRAIEYLEFYKQSNESTTDQMESYYIEEIFKKIYKISESNISTEEKNIIVSFEFYYIMILSNYHNNNSLPKYIREIFVTDPHMLAEVIKNAYQLDRSDLNNTVIIENSYKILFKLKVCPSEREKGKIDEKELLEWVKTYCEIISNNNQLEIGMQKLGECFAYSPPGTDGIFPHEAVRTVFENYTDENLKKGFIIGVYNKRGVYIGTSGSNEIEISKEYKKYAEATRIDFPNISRALLSISERYRKEGEHERELAINDL